jgi:hypothetical protein
MIDQNNDTTFSKLREIIKDLPQIKPLIKKASVGEEVRNSLNTAAFADRANRRFPVNSAADTILSKAYATKVANLADSVMAEIDTALDMYSIDRSLFNTAKVAHARQEPNYLLESQRKWAITKTTSIKLAEQALFRNKNKLAPKTLSNASLKLIKEAHSRGEEVNTRTLKYAGLVQCDSKYARDWLEARAHKATNTKVAEAFTKLSNVMSKVDNSITRDDLIKVSSAINQLDKVAGFTKHYGRNLPDPVETIFNTKTAMQPSLNLGGKDIPLEKLMAISPEAYGDILGSDIVDEITDNGELAPDKLSAVLDTLPKDMKDSLVQGLSL